MKKTVVALATVALAVSTLVGCAAPSPAVNAPGAPLQLQYTQLQPLRERPPVYGSDVPDTPESDQRVLDHEAQMRTARQKADAEKAEHDRADADARRLSIPCHEVTTTGWVAGTAGFMVGPVSLLEGIHEGTAAQRAQLLRNFPFRWYPGQVVPYCIGVTRMNRLHILVEPYRASWVQHYGADVAKTYVLGVARIELANGAESACEVLTPRANAVCTRDR